MAEMSIRELAEHIVRYRAKKRLSQVNFSRAVGMSPMTLYKIEKCITRSVHPTTYYRIVDYINSHK